MRLFIYRLGGKPVDEESIEKYESRRKLKYHRVWQWADKAINNRELFPDTPDVDTVLEVFIIGWSSQMEFRNSQHEQRTSCCAMTGVQVILTYTKHNSSASDKPLKK